MHSLKDLPTEMPPGLEIVALLPREDPRDVLVVNSIIGAESIDELPPGSRVGTSSLRRRAQLLAARRDLDVVELRGNVPTRLKKVDDGQVHAAILAAAGLHRLGVPQHITAYLDAPEWLPAAGQGAIAIQIRSDDRAHARRLRAARRSRHDDRHHGGARVSWRRSRADVRCRSARSRWSARRVRVLHGFIADVKGTRIVRGEIALDVDQPELSGVRLANELRHRGASEILESLRRADHLPSPQPE